VQGRHVLSVALALAVTAMSGPVLAVAGAAPSGTLVLVVSAPGPGARDALIRSAGGRPVGPSQAALAGFATSRAPDFPRRLRDAGAWLVLDGARIARICGFEA
jgi:hypothetical protein